MVTQEATCLNALGDGASWIADEVERQSARQARMKRPGAWWTIHNAQNMIKLQTLRHNGQWDHHWQPHLSAA